MALGPRLDLRQSQSLVMTPQLQQAIKLLALSNLEIESFISDALETNPLLEAGELRSQKSETSGETPPEPSADAPLDGISADGTAGGANGDNALDIDKSSLDTDRDTGDGEMGDGEWGASGTGSGLSAMGDDLPGIEERSSASITLAQHLEGQIGGVTNDPREEFTARYIIGLLDEAGYLPTDLRDVALDLDIAPAEATRALEIVQSLDPTGIGARNLAECIALQAKEADRYDPCMARLIDNLDLVAKGEFARLKRMCDVDDEDFADMLGELRNYNPKPGLLFGGEAESAIMPDILVRPGKAGGWDIQLNEETLPRLVVNRGYLVELREGCNNKESQSWLNEKLTDANWLIKALDQRQKTILKTTSEIVKQQEAFFREGVSGLKPLTLREVAEKIDMHESTISRVTSNKYLHCDRGTFELKYFFTSGVGADADGEGGASSASVKARIKALCDGEDPKKILSDDKLVELLKGEGFELARRTVAKYREAMGIGSSVQRRRAKKLAAM